VRAWIHALFIPSWRDQAFSARVRHRQMGPMLLVTERHYSPWVKARQDQLETEVRRIWSASDAATI